MVWVVDILTTDGNSFAARSAKPSGPGFARTGPASCMTAPTIRAMATRFSQYPAPCPILGDRALWVRLRLAMTAVK